MNLSYEDSHVIASYYVADHPNHRGPVIIDLENLEELHMRSAASHVHLALLFASGKLFSGKRAAS